MTKSYSDAYKAAGVDVTAGYKAVELMKKHVSRTTTLGVLDSIGGFGGLFAPDMTGMKKPVLVSGTDGVGTKLKLAMLLDKHDTVGIDCVAMCVNDVVCAGAQPLFFLDYIACGKNNPEDYILTAIEKGFTSVGLSGHSFTKFDTEYCMSEKGTLEYLKELKNLKEKYKNRIQVYVGIEADFYSGFNPKLDENLGLDFRIGSVHYIKDNLCQ